MRSRIGKTGHDADLRARRPAATPTNVHGRGVRRSLAESCRCFAPGIQCSVAPRHPAPTTLRGLPMSQSSQLVSPEAKAAPFLALRAESPASHDSAPPMQVIRRNGTVSKFDASKISVAMTKAFLAVEGHTAAASRRVHEIVEQLTDDVVTALSRRASEGRTFHIEDVQDQVELALMRSEHHKVARAYVLYREERTRRRAEEAAAKPVAPSNEPTIHVTMPDGART